LKKREETFKLFVFSESGSTIWTVNVSFRKHDLAREDIVTFGAGEAALMPLLLESRDTHSVDRLCTFSANGSSSLVIMLLAIRETFVLKELSIGERLGATSASEVVSVPVFVESCDCCSVNDGLVALGAGVAKQFVVVLETIRILILLIELSVGKGLVADSAGEAMLVEVLVESLQVTTLDGFATTRTSWQEGTFVASQTICFSVFVEKLFGSNVFSASSAREALEVIKRSQSLQSVSVNVSSTNSTRSGGWRCIRVSLLLESAVVFHISESVLFCSSVREAIFHKLFLVSSSRRSH